MAAFGNPFQVLVACLMLSSIRAFGPRLEPLSHAQSYNHGYASHLYASSEAEQNHHDSSESSSLQQSYACEFDLVSAPFDGLDDFSSLFNNAGFDGTFPFLQEQADAMALGTNEDNNSLEFDIWENESLELCGDECKECEIPNDWFATSPGDEIDVMKFLGVARVQPLQ